MFNPGLNPDNRLNWSELAVKSTLYSKQVRQAGEGRVSTASEISKQTGRWDLTTPKATKRTKIIK